LPHFQAHGRASDPLGLPRLTGRPSGAWPRHRGGGRGTKVTVVDQIAKLAWDDNRLYLELHPSRSQLDELEVTGLFEDEPVEGLLELIEEAAGTHADRLDLAAIARAERERRGFPVMITNP
jgi:hypothetical protein